MNELKLSRIEIAGFKAVKRLSLTISSEMTLLIGMNGSGKSSVLQAIGLLRFLAEGRPQAFFDERSWDRQDLRFRSNPRGRSTVVSISTIFDSQWGRVRWDIRWGLNSGKLYSEEIRVRDEKDLSIREILNYSAKDGGALAGLTLPPFIVDGSILAAIPNLQEIGEEGKIAKSVHRWAIGVRSLELLSPHFMRGHARVSVGDLGVKGDKLPGFLATLSGDQKSRIVQRLARVYPIKDLSTVRKRAGWLSLKIGERFNNMSEISSQHLSDGFMRLLALCAIPELPEDVSIVLLDEIEDGIEPHILSRIVEMVKNECSSQIVATSHSPLLINSIPIDDIRLVSRSIDGDTIATPAKDLETFTEGSDYMGAGELWVNVDLMDLSKDVERATAIAADAEAEQATEAGQ